MANISLTEVVNSSLIRLGMNPLSDVETDSNREAVRVRQIKGYVIEDVLSQHPWNGPSQRVKLNQLSNAPTWGFDHAYQLPGDFVRLIRTDDEGHRYRIEGDKLLSDANEMQIVYVAYTEDPNLWQAPLRRAISYRFSAELAMALTGDVRVEQTFASAYEEALRSARVEDSRAAGMEQVQGSTWVDARDQFGGSSSLEVGNKT